MKKSAASLALICLLVATATSAQPRDEGVPEGQKSAWALFLGAETFWLIPSMQGLWLYLGSAGNVCGRLSDTIGRPIGGALVSVREPKGMELWRGRSAQDGSFWALGLLEGGSDVEVQFSHPDYAAAGLWAKTSGSILPSSPLSIALLQTPLVQGVVIDEEGQPLADSTIVLSFKEEHLEARPKAEGWFYFEGLPHDGYFKFAVSAPGFALIEQEFKATRDGFNLGTLQMRREQKREGIVLDTAGRPIADARLSLHSTWERDSRLIERGDSGEPWTRTGKNGRFALTGMPRGNLLALEVHADDFLPVWIKLDDESTNLEIVLERGAWVSGTVRDSRGQAFAHATVEVKPLTAAHEGGLFTFSDEDGNFALGPLEPGQRFFAASEYYDLSPGDPVFVPAQGLEHLELRLKESVTLNGVIRDSDGVPIEGAFIEISVPDIVNMSVGDSLADGTFEATDLPSGRAFFKAGHQLFGSIEREVELRPGMPPIDIQLPSPVPADDLRVVALSPYGPVQSAKVVARDLRYSKREVSAETSDRGEAILSGLVEGRYRLQIAHPDFAPYSSEYAVVGGSNPAIEVSLESAFLIEGHIAQISPLDLVQLEARAFDDAQSKQVTIELNRETGAFRVGGLTPGVWSLRFGLGSFRAVTRRVRVGERPIFLEIDWSEAVE